MNKLSTLAHTLIPSEIIKQGNAINDKIAQGEKIYNFTIGDFNPQLYPIPAALESLIIEAYQNKKTNYPPAPGIAPLRKAVSGFLKRHLGLQYSDNEILIAGGGRPLIYAAYRALVDKDDKVVYPVPSWNNNHYTHFVEGKHCVVETTAENNFMPTAEELEPHLQDARLLAVCSPLNPSGTIFSKEELTKICQLIVSINQQRAANERPLFLLFDQMYWTLTFGDHQHFDPVSVCPEIRDYTVYIDGISKAFCATGVRVGWSMGPIDIIDKMKGILSHIGAWSPMAEQVATAQFLENEAAVEQHLNHFKSELWENLSTLYHGITALSNKSLPIACIPPQGAMYLTLSLDIIGKKTGQGSMLTNLEEVTTFMLEQAQLAIVPFTSFGASAKTTWYRLSVGVCNPKDIPTVLSNIEKALNQLS